MDTIKYKIILQRLEEIQGKIEALESSKSWIEIYGPTIIGMLAILASLYIGYKQVQSNTINTIRLDTINKLRNTMLELFSDFEKYIQLRKVGASKTELESTCMRINTNCVSMNILIDSRDSKHKIFKSTLDQIHESVTKQDSNYTTILGEWQSKKQNLLNRFDSLIEMEINKI